MEMGLISRTAWAARVQKARRLKAASEDATLVLGGRRLGLLPDTARSWVLAAHSHLGLVRTLG